MKINNIQAGKKIKAKTKLKYVGTLQDKVGFISLKIVMKININSIFT